MEVETRVCGDCEHHERLIGGSICKRHLMVVTRTMNVCYDPQKGTCFIPKVTDAAAN